MDKTFQKYIEHHRNLLEQGTREFPTLFKRSDLTCFDIVAAQNKHLSEGFQPVVWLKDPREFLMLNPTVQQKLWEHAFRMHGTNIITERYRTPGSEEIGPDATDDITESDIEQESNKALQSQLAMAMMLQKHVGEMDEKVTDEVPDGWEPQQRAVFVGELQDIIKELDGIYGRLDPNKSEWYHKLGTWAKKVSWGNLQRLTGRLFGAGKADDSQQTLKSMSESEKKQYNQLAKLLQEGPLVTGFNLANATPWQEPIRHGVSHAVRHAANALVGGGKTKAATGAAHSLATGAMKGLAPLGKGALASSGVGHATVAGGLSTGAMAGIGAGVAALLAVGAAGMKMRQRRLRLEKLRVQAIRMRKAAGIGIPAVLATPLVTAPEAEAAKPPESATPATQAASTPEIVAAIKDPEFKQKLVDIGAQAYANSAEELPQGVQPGSDEHKNIWHTEVVRLIQQERQKTIRESKIGMKTFLKVAGDERVIDTLWKHIVKSRQVKLLCVHSKKQKQNQRHHQDRQLPRL